MGRHACHYFPQLRLLPDHLLPLLEHLCPLMLTPITTLCNFSLSFGFISLLRHSAMFRRLHSIRGCGRQGRGAQAECQIPLSPQTSGEGFDIEIPEAVRMMVNDWEDELSGAGNAAR